MNNDRFIQSRWMMFEKLVGLVPQQTNWETDGVQFRKVTELAMTLERVAKRPTMLIREPSEGSVLTFDTLELWNDAPFGPEPKGPAPSLPEGREGPNSPVGAIGHRSESTDAKTGKLTSEASVSIHVG
jgi:hypothetical protein